MNFDSPFHGDDLDAEVRWLREVSHALGSPAVRVIARDWEREAPCRQKT